MQRFLTILMAGALLGSSGCLFSGTEDFACNSADTDCPEGKVCDTTLNRCVDVGGADGGGEDGGGGDGGTDGGATDGGGGDGGTCVPQTAACNGADDDCDGATDESDELGVPPACSSQQGVCAGASQLCEGGLWVDCAATGYQATEVPNGSCDALDNDCNGITDPGCPTCQLGDTQVCGETGGVCSLGAQACTDQNVWGTCSGVLPGAEVCDALDNDCDGETDEPVDVPPLTCPLTMGVCFGAEVACSNGVRPSCLSAYGASFEPAELTCDDLDNNCDGFTDVDSFGLPLQRSCLKQDGVCAGSITQCAGGEFPACTDADYAAHDALYDPGPDADCDGIDNDCDGLTDEDFVGTVDCHPAGTQGVCAGVQSNCFGGVETCPTPTGYEAVEASCDGLDNDCDGNADPSCSCTFGDPDQPCSTDVGACVSGTQTCLLAGTWDTCTGTGPSSEICDGIDNNCDGVTDDGFGIGAACSPGLGECNRDGEIRCATTATTECSVQAGTPAADESCDGLDNDCDGITDEDNTTGGALTQDCSPSTGVCANVISTCTGGGFPACDFGPLYEVAETRCDGEDNDCDGSTDVGLTAPLCALRTGVCAGSTQTCGGGSGWLACSVTTYENHDPDYEPNNEVSCDGLDNDCDGLTDEDASGLPLLGTCGLNLGVCAGVTSVCTNGMWGSCNYGSDYEATETSCDGLDNDCDGDTDDADADLSCQCTNNQTETCGTDEGACVSGTRTCSAGVWGACSGTGPAAEICDGVDNDCDAFTDEDASDQPLSRLCPLNVGVCLGSRETCNGTTGWSGCDYAAHALANGELYEVSETRCDGLDNDCDGTADGPVADADCALADLCTAGSCGATGCITTVLAAGTPCGPGCTCGAGGVARETGCGDWIDNDQDGYTDCVGEGDCFSDPICVPKCGDAKCNPFVECNNCAECAGNTACFQPGCGGGNTDCDIFGGECGRCQECQTDSRCSGNSCGGTVNCLPSLGQCVMGCSTCATHENCSLSSCVGSSTCSPLSNECNTCSTFPIVDCSASSSECSSGTCSDGRCSPETGECAFCVDEGDDCDGAVICNGFSCNDNICNPLLGECRVCLGVGQDCRSFSGAPVAACHGFTESCQVSGDSDGDGLDGCADPDCEGTTCATGCTCQNGDCVDASKVICN